MKIAVITLKDSPNYGGILQAYALQRALNSLGLENDLIDYINPEFEKKFTFFGKPKDMSTVYWIFKKLQYPLMIRMKNQMLSFYKHMSLTEKFSDSVDLKTLNKKYDIFITGSDQVWACDLIHYDPAYLLGFVERGKKKIAYATSFGRTINTLKDVEREFLARYISSFNAISVREASGVPIVESMSNINAIAVLDPTLLLSMDDWTKVLQTPNRAKDQEGKYILCYLMQTRKNDREALLFAKRLAKEKDLRLIKICRGLTSVLWGETIYVPTVEEWLGLYKNAHYVVTNSFHGTAFAINFNKDFTSFIEGNINEGRNSRISSICRNLGLESRIHQIGDTTAINISSINWANVNKKLDMERKKSISFLRKALEMN